MHALAMLLFVVGTLVPFETNGRWGYKDGGGKIVIPERYQAAQEFSSEGIAAVVDEKGWAYIDTSGRVRIRPLVIDNGPDYFEQDLARFAQGGRVGFFDRHGRIVIQARWNYATSFSEGLAAVCDGCVESADGEHRVVTGGRWGFINRRGETAIPLRFEETTRFENGRAQVRLQGKWRSIDKNGTLTPE